MYVHWEGLHLFVMWWQGMVCRLTVSLEMIYRMLFPDLSYDVQPGLDVSVCTNSLRTYIPISAATMHPFATSNNLECRDQAPYLCWAT